MTEEFLDQLTGHVDDGAEGETKSGPISLPVLVVPEKAKPNELQAICDLGRELHQLNLDRVIFEETSFHTGEITSIVGELDADEVRVREAIEKLWESKLDAARLKDQTDGT